jgi:hypothetical protein
MAAENQRMSNIRATDVKTQIARQVQAETRAAAGGNSLISKDEQKTLAPELQRAADEVRAAGGPGTRVTAEAVEGAFQQRFTSAIDAVNQSSGSGRAWLSKAEIDALKQRDPAVGERAQKAWDILAGRTTPTPTPSFNSAQFGVELQRVAQSFQFESSFGTEGGQPMQAVVAGGGPYTSLDANVFKAAFGLTANTPDHKIERDVPAAQVLAELTASVVQPIYSAQQENDAKTIARLIGSLKDARAFVLGEDGTTGPVHPTYIVGIDPNGNIQGIKTGVVWT